MFATVLLCVLLKLVLNSPSKINVIIMDRCYLNLENCEKMHVKVSTEAFRDDWDRKLFQARQI